MVDRHRDGSVIKAMTIDKRLVICAAGTTGRRTVGMYDLPPHALSASCHPQRAGFPLG
jgi:hypothetical protein